METLAQAAVGRHGAGQDDWELDHALAVIAANLPDGLIVEIGCDQGGTLWLWRQLGRPVIGVTLHTRTDGVFHPHGATVIEGDSTTADTRRRVAEAVNGRPVAMVFVDGGHDYETACADIAWAIDIAPRGLVVVHDVNRRLNHPECETYMAWAEFAEDRPHIVIARGGDRSPGTGILFPRGT